MPVLWNKVIILSQITVFLFANAWGLVRAEATAPLAYKFGVPIFHEFAKESYETSQIYIIN